MGRWYHCRNLQVGDKLRKSQFNGSVKQEAGAAAEIDRRDQIGV